MPEYNVKKARNKFESLVEEGLVFDAAKLLGMAYCISGIIIEGNKIGRTLGYPTANVQPKLQESVIPAQGVYVAFARFKGAWYKSMVNVGVRPTLNLERETIEAHLFDFDQQAYNQPIALHFIERLRDEKRFGSIAELKNQLDEDFSKSKELFERIGLKPSPENEMVFIDNCSSTN